MSEKIVKSLIDDIDGTPADETVGFGLDGIAYEIDLSRRNAAGLRDALAKYVGASRRRGHRSRMTPSRVTPLGASSRTIREWAKANDVRVPAKGRVPAAVVAQFNEVNKR